MNDRIRLFLDEHIDAAIAAGLRRNGIDVETVVELGRRGVANIDYVIYALAERRVIVTFDQDYLAIHATGVNCAGIAFFPYGHPAIGHVVSSLVILHGVYGSDAMANVVQYL